MFLLNGSLVQKGFCVLGTRSIIILGFAIYYQVEKSTPACCVVHGFTVYTSTKTVTVLHIDSNILALNVAKLL